MLHETEPQRQSHFFGRKEAVENFSEGWTTQEGKHHLCGSSLQREGWSWLGWLSTRYKGKQSKEPCPREMGPRWAARHSPSRGEALASGALGPISGAPFLGTLDIHLSRPCCRTKLMSFVGGNRNGPTANLAHFWPFPSDPPFLEKHRTRWIKSRVWKQLFTHKFIAASKDWRREEKGTTGWDGWMASPTWGTWVWVSSRCWWWTGKPGVLQSVGSQKSRTRLSDWTKLNHTLEIQCGSWRRIWLIIWYEAYDINDILIFYDIKSLP